MKGYLNNEEATKEAFDQARAKAFGIAHVGLANVCSGLRVYTDAERLETCESDAG